jgi:uncharacterized membrane protein
MSDLYKIFILFIIIISIDLCNILYFSNEVYVNQYNKINGNKNGIIMDTNKFIITIILYLLFAFAVYYLVLQTSTSYLSILFKSILLALAISFTYNGTNLITLDKYEYSVGIRDTIWSVILFSLSVSIAYFLDFHKQNTN